MVTRMHSSRMRTGRSLTVCCSLLPGGGCLVRGGLLWWGVWSGGSAPGGGGGAWSGGSAPGGLSGPEGIPACTEADTPLPPVDRHTLVKTLPWPNFVAAGKKLCYNEHPPIASSFFCIFLLVVSGTLGAKYFLFFFHPSSGATFC